MLNYRCTQCQKPHPYSAPAFCACGATTFTLIHEADAGGASESGSTTAAGVVDLPSAAVLAGAIGAAVFGDEGPLQRYVFQKTSELVDGPPTPRDAPHVVGHVDAALAAPEAGDVELVAAESHDVGGIQCGQQGCTKPATHKFFWPEPGKRSQQYACEPHARAAEGIGQTMGFSVDVEPLRAS